MKKAYLQAMALLLLLLCPLYIMTPSFIGSDPICTQDRISPALLQSLLLLAFVCGIILGSTRFTASKIGFRVIFILLLVGGLPFVFFLVAGGLGCLDWSHYSF